MGILQLSVEVTHYIVPSKEAAAYLQAKVRLKAPESAKILFFRDTAKERAR